MSLNKNINTSKKEKQPSKLRIWFQRWGKFSFSSYKKGFSKSAFYWSLILLSAFIIFHGPVKELLNVAFVAPILHYCPENYGSDLVFGVFLLYAIGISISRITRQIVPTINSVVLILVIIIIHFVFFKSGDTYQFYHYKASFANNITYATTFLFSLLLMGVSYKPYFTPLSKDETQYSLLDDYPSPDNYEDLYGRTSYATDIAKHIQSTSCNVSFAVGIIGDWGTGKSDFMQRIKTALKEDPTQENIIFDFNPWRVSKADGIIEEFFKTLSKQLAPFNRSITSTINDYSSRVLKPAKEIHIRHVDYFVGNLLKDEDIQQQYDTINELIKATSKRLVIFIDDVDRLTGKEVMEVLRVIRNTANFANTFFIVGIDQNYIVNVLRNTKDFSNEEEYLKKVFQLMISLPAFKKENFVSEIKRNLFTGDMEEKDKTMIKLALSHIGMDPQEEGHNWNSPDTHIEFLLDNLLGSVRDLKRFCNSFKISFNILKEEAEISDLIVLELLKNKSIHAYNCIRNRKILSYGSDIVSSNQFIVDEKELKKIEDQLPEYDRPVIKDAIDFLFTDKPFKNQRKIVLAHNFYIYFSYQLFDLISFREFNQALEKDTDEMVAIFTEWNTKEKQRELSRIITYIDNFSDSNQLGKVVRTLLRIWQPGSDWFDHTKRLIISYWEHNNNRYFQDDVAKHKQFIFSTLDDNSIDLFTRALLANQFLINLKEGRFKEELLSIREKELRNKIYHLFDEYIKSNPDDPKKTLDFYYLNDYSYRKGIGIIFPPASKIFKKYLQTSPNGFKGYVKKLLRPSATRYTGKLVLDPWMEQIFVDWKLFKDKLSKSAFDTEEEEKLKRIILEHIDEYFSSGQRPFEIKDEKDRKFVDMLLGTKILGT